MPEWKHIPRKQDVLRLRCGCDVKGKVALVSLPNPGCCQAAAIGIKSSNIFENVPRSDFKRIVNSCSEF